MYVAEEKNSGAELDPGPSGPLSLKMIHRIIFSESPAKEFFIPFKFSGRALSSAQENLHTEENDPSFSWGASTLSMPRTPEGAVLPGRTAFHGRLARGRCRENTSPRVVFSALTACYFRCHAQYIRQRPGLCAAKTCQKGRNMVYFKMV